MIISGFDKLSLVNFPGVVACTVFTNGCQWRCSFCQNSTLSLGTDPNRVPEDEVIAYLEKRKGLVDGICISGGEPTLQHGLTEFARRCKEVGVRVKLDTNGTSPRVVREMLEAQVLDYIAMDVKMPFETYSKIVNGMADAEVLQETINLIKEYGRGIEVEKILYENSYAREAADAKNDSNSEKSEKKSAGTEKELYKIDYEFRTTIMKEFHDKKTIEEILKIVGPDSPYYLQNFEDSDYVFDHSLNGFSDDELKELDTWIKTKHKHASVRGLKWTDRIGDGTRADDEKVCKIGETTTFNEDRGY